jgi:EmrB/QacA subfamily drug resistance transporter
VETESYSPSNGQLNRFDSESERENMQSPLATSISFYLDKPERYLTLAAAMGSFLTALDSSAVNSVLPLIRADFDTSIPMVQWVLLAELLVTTGLLLAFGRLGDQLGHKRIYSAGFVVFFSGCAFCAGAPTVAALIAFRIIQGIGAAMLMVSSPALLVKHSPAKRRGRVLGLRASLIYLGLAAGPAVGGWLAGRYGWRAVFWMQLPVILAGLILTHRVIVDDPSSAHPPTQDFAGAFTWIGFLAALLFGLNRGTAWGWTSPAVLLPLLVSAMFLIAFQRIERGRREPMIDLSLFDNSSFSLPVATLVLSFVSGYLLTVLLPFCLIQGRHMRPAAAGLILAAYGLIRVAAAPLSGRWSDNFGPRWPATFGAGTLAAGTLFLSRLGQDSSVVAWTAGALIAGAGLGIFVPPNNSMLLGAVPRSRHGVASGVLATSRNVGMGLGVALAGITLPRVLEGAGKAESAAAIIRASHGGFILAAAIAFLAGLICALARQRTVSAG